MKNNKGQALVEFVLIIPVFFLVLFSAVDIGNLILKKYHLESDLDYVVELYNQNKTDEINAFIAANDLKITYDVDIDNVNIKLEKDVYIITPGIDNIIDNPYSVEVERTFIYEG